MILVSFVQDLLRQVYSVMTAPTFASVVTLLTGWVFARRRKVTGMFWLRMWWTPSTMPPFCRVFAVARWSQDVLGLVLLTGGSAAAP